MKKITTTLAALGLSASLAACGTTMEERVATGALAGGAVGAVAGKDLGSAAVGAAVGAGAGYAVDRCKRTRRC